MTHNLTQPTETTGQPRRMWVVWLMFFFQFAAIGVYFTYLNVYFQRAGLSGTQIGLLNMITALVGVISSIGWGYLSDHTGQPRLWIAIGAAGTLIINQFIPLVSGFMAFLALSSLGSLFSSAPGTLIDSTVLLLLGSRREDYGRFRMGGSIGYILTALPSGFLFEKTGLGLIFPAYGIVMGGLVITALLLPRRNKPSTPAVESEQGKGKGPNRIGLMIRQPAWILFIICTFLCWIATNASIMFLNVSLSTMGATSGLIGMVSTIGAVIEMPFMLYSGNLLRKYGPLRLLVVAMILMVIRYTLLGLMPNPWWAIPINMINGPAFVFFWNSAVTYANKMASADLAGTAQGLLVATTSLAGMVSSMLTGWLLDLLGPTGVFFVMAGCCLVALILFVAGNSIQRPRKPAEATVTG